MLGPETSGICSASTHFVLRRHQRVWVEIMTSDIPAKRMRSCKNGAVVVGRSRLGWNEIIVLPFMFRIRCTERRSSTRRRLSAIRSVVSTKTREFLQVSTYWNTRTAAHAGQSSVYPGGCGYY